MSKIKSTKDWYLKHERPILLTTVAVTVTALVLTRVGLAQHNQFLKDHDLYDEYYLPE